MSKHFENLHFDCNKYAWVYAAGSNSGSCDISPEVPRKFDQTSDVWYVQIFCGHSFWVTYFSNHLLHLSAAMLRVLQKI